MIKTLHYLTKNARFVCLADFFWNLGRTLPHAILTIFLISQGCTLVEIALLQSVFMIVAMISEFPSGVIADFISRKIVYLVSICTLFLSYFLICFFSNSFVMLVIAYILYGFSVSLKSGTLEAEVVLEYDKSGIDIKYYSVATSYVMSASSIIGGLVGSFFYEHIHQYIYIISLVLFVISFVTALICSFQNDLENISENEKNISLVIELKNSFQILQSSKTLLYILCLSAISTLFLQPFFQYWQVLYQENNVSVEYFGIVYVAFQICNLLAAIIYKKLKINKGYVITIICFIPIVFAISLVYEKAVLVLLPIVVVLFYVYHQHLDVIVKKEAPKCYMSSFFLL